MLPPFTRKSDLHAGCCFQIAGSELAQQIADDLQAANEHFASIAEKAKR
jgi:hypothetical protein